MFYSIQEIYHLEIRTIVKSHVCNRLNACTDGQLLDPRCTGKYTCSNFRPSFIFLLGSIGKHYACPLAQLVAERELGLMDALWQDKFSKCITTVQFSRVIPKSNEHIITGKVCQRQIQILNL